MRRWLVALLVAPSALLATPAFAAPPAPAITSPSYGATVHSTTPRFSGTGRPGDTLIVSEMGVVACTATVSAAGTWSCVPSTPLLNGVHLMQARQTDRDGRASNGSDSVKIVVQVAGERTPPTVVPPKRPRSTGPVAPATPAASDASSGPTWVVPLAIAAIVALAIIVGVVLWVRMRPRRR